MSGLPSGGIAAQAAEEAGQPLRTMTFNIWRSGLLDGAEGGQENLAQLIEFVRSEDPDVLFTVETYGSGPTIRDGLNEGVPEDRRYEGIQLTREPGQTSDEDNLWLFTRLDVDEVYPAKRAEGVSSFHFGGARLLLPDGRPVHAFTTWLRHVGGAWSLANQSAIEEDLGLDRTHTDEEVLATDLSDRKAQAKTILEEWLPAYVGDQPGPVIMGGDFNTLSHLDWSADHAGAPGHGGLNLGWPVTAMYTDAGFTDTFRSFHPDVAKYPGRTWSPVVGFGYAPGRIDYIMARGDEVEVRGAHVRDRRRPEHQDFAGDEMFPFYSDHAAVVSDLLIKGTGPGPDPNDPPAEEEPETGTPGWPDPPPGTAVPADELTATASSENAGAEAPLAVDGDPRTFWHSGYEPEPDPQPHTYTIDMTGKRALSALRYQPRIVGNPNGTVLRGTVELSDDGSEYRKVADVEWDRTTPPKDVDLTGQSARYLRLTIDLGIGGLSSAGEFTPYEDTD